MANAPARTKKAAPKKPQGEEWDDVRLISRDEDDETFVAEIFGEEEFTFSTDVNAYLLLNAVRDGGGFLDLMDSLVVVDTNGTDPKKVEADRTKERDRFHDLLKRQKHLSVERLAVFIGEITELAGNETDDSSSTD